MEFLRFPTIGEARLHSPEAALVINADYGGQVLLSCPLRLIQAGEEAVETLFRDLIDMTWGCGFEPGGSEAPDDEARRFYVKAEPWSWIPGGMGGGGVLEGLWLHDELEKELMLREQIEGVLAGRQRRLDLPAKFPNCDLTSLGAIRPYPYGVVDACGGRIRLFACRAEMVQVGEEELHELARDLAKRMNRRRAGWPIPKIVGEVSIRYYPRQKELPEKVADLWLYPFPQIREWEGEVREVLAGRRGRLSAGS